MTNTLTDNLTVVDCKPDFTVRLLTDTLRQDGLSDYLAWLGARVVAGIDTYGELVDYGLIDTTQYFQLRQAGVI